MEKFLAVWENEQGIQYRTIEADTLPEAKHEAFRMMCDESGKKIYDLNVYAKRYEFFSEGEYNPLPSSKYSSAAERDYYTGLKIKKN